MAKITESIPVQNFEKCKHEIAFILQAEIDNQILLISDNISVPVFLDRKIPVDNSENIVINVYLVEGEYSEITNVSSEGSYIFNVDIYVYGNQHHNKY